MNTPAAIGPEMLNWSERMLRSKSKWIPLVCDQAALTVLCGRNEGLQKL